MASTTIVDIVSFFYPVGNTPAVFLSEGLPREQKANVLSLGCGDVRNILFTAHVAEGASQIDITCCDIESLVIARNVILLTLLLDDEDGSQVKNIWDIYYHLYLGQRALALLENQARKLQAISGSLQSWHASKYGRLLRICDNSSLSKIKQIWSTLSLSTLSEVQMSSYADRFWSNFQKAKDLRRAYIGEGVVITGIRSAAPLSLAAIKDLTELHKHYWDIGSTDKHDENDVKFPNPMFASQPSDSFTLHYGTDPLLGFHLATVYAPLDSDTVPDPHGFLQSSAHQVVRVARQQFQAWSDSFRRYSSKTIVLRFFVGEALAFCHALQRMRTADSPAGPYRTPGSFGPLLLDGEDYQSTATAPLLFNVIDTSNLIDHVGAMNLFIAASPLLDDSPFATLYTESLVKREKSHSALVESFLCGHALSMSVFLGLFPTEYWTNVAPASAAEETLWDSTTRIGGEDRNSSGQMFSRLSWKRYMPDNPPTAQNEPPIRFREADLAKLLFEVYLNMFQNENIKHLMSNLDLLSIERSSCSRYHRGSFALFLRFIKNHVATDNWDKVMNNLISYIEDDTNIMTGRNHIQELFVQLHLQKTFSVPVLLSAPAASGSHSRSTLLKGWKDLPEVLCLTLKVPRKHLKVLTGLARRKLNTPAVQCVLQSSGSFPGRPWQNIFSIIHLAFGEATTSGSGKSNIPSLEVHEDEHRWLGESPLLVSFLVPTWIVLLDAQDATLAFGIQSTPRNAATFCTSFGYELKVYETTLGNKENVFITKDLPYGANPMSHNPMTNASGDRDDSLQHDLHASVTANLKKGTARIESFTGRIEFSSEKVKSVLSNGADVRTAQLSPFSISVIIGNEFRHDVHYPTPVQLRCGKIKVARKSSYIEIVAPIDDPVNCGEALRLVYPVISTKRFPVPWNIPRVNLTALPILDVKQKDRMQWLISHCSLMFSSRERRARDAWHSSTQNNVMDTKARFKDSLFSIFMHQTGLQGQKANIFGLNNPSNGGIHVLVFASSLRLDPANRTVVLDAAVLVLTNRLMPRISALLQILTSQGICSIKVGDEELQFWKEAIPAFVERCRQWNHRTTCEYVAASKIPLSTKNGETPLCSCGDGKVLDDIVARVPELKMASQFAVRAAISPSFASPFVEQLFQGPAVRPQQNMGDQNCWRCGMSNAVDVIELQRCSRCRKARYCSVTCQRADWKVHKASCRA